MSKLTKRKSKFEKYFQAIRFRSRKLLIKLIIILHIKNLYDVYE